MKAVTCLKMLQNDNIKMKDLTCLKMLQNDNIKMKAVYISNCFTTIILK